MCLFHNEKKTLCCSCSKTGNPVPDPFILPFFLTVSPIIYETGMVVCEMAFMIFICTDSFTYCIAEFIPMGDRCHDISQKNNQYEKNIRWAVHRR